MRGSVANKGPDVCLFCALRLGGGSFAGPARSLSQVRSYNSNATLRRPGAAQAVERDDEGDYTPITRYGARAPPPQPRGKGYSSPDTLTIRRPYPSSNYSSRDAYPPREPSTQSSRSRPPQSSAFEPRGQFSRADTSSQRGFDRPRQEAWRPSPATTGHSSTRNVPAPGPSKARVLSGFEAFENATRVQKDSQTPRARNNAQPYQRRAESARPPSRPFQRESRPFNPQRSRDAQTSFQRPFPGQSRDDPHRLGPSLPPSMPSEEVDDFDAYGNDAGRNNSKGRKLESREDRRNRRYAIDGQEDEPSLKRDSKKSASRLDPAEEEMERIEALLSGEESRKKRKVKERPAQPTVPQIQIPEWISVQNLAVALNVRPHLFLEKLEEEGYEEAQQDHILDAQTSAMFAELYGYQPVLLEQTRDIDLVARPPVADQSLLPPRPPVVTIMGHVDHGKTTILDWLRKSSVVESEHGGITQHIGAFSVTMPVTERAITFLDTPGHAAFLDMRKRGAIVTDIVVLVVAADDSVKPQTIEAIKHATEANVHIIVAINKIDKEDAYVEKVWQDLARHGISVEDYGGDTQAIPISGKTGQGMDALEEAIVTLADVSDFRAEMDGPAEGWIIESKVTTAGRVATVLVRRGTLRTGDCVVAGSTWARIRTLRNDAGQLVSEALPGTPVQVDGWRGEDPTAGLEVLQADDEQHAKEVVDVRMSKAESVRAVADTIAINKSKTEDAAAYATVREWRAEQGFVGRKTKRAPRATVGWQENAAESGPKRVPFVVKADVAGSAEAIAAVISAIGNDEVAADVIRSETGLVSESDIKLLAGTGEAGYVISFNQQVDATMYRLAEAAEIRILDHNIIYKVTDDVKDKLSDELPPNITQRVLGEAEIGQIFDISVKKKTMKVAGCKITNGTINRSQKVRVLRSQEVIYTGTLESLKNVKKDVNEMRKGSECGMSFDNWTNFQEGDQIQSFEEISEKRKLY